MSSLLSSSLLYLFLLLLLLLLLLLTLSGWDGHGWVWMGDMTMV